MDDASQVKVQTSALSEGQIQYLQVPLILLLNQTVHL